MTALVVQPATDLPGPVLPDLGKLAVEKRRRPLTVVFGLLIAVLVVTTGSRWPIAGGGRELLSLAGMLLACIGAFGRIWSNLFISGYKTKQLVTTGPYSVCRNPLYFFSAIGMVGVGLATETISLPVLLIVFFAIYYPIIISTEEGRLLIRHDEAFESYRRQTPAFWPKWTLYAEPDSYVMQPRTMRKNLADAFWFIALAAIVQAEAHLSPLSGIPAIVNLW